jgi:hypothetical protein
VVVTNLIKKYNMKKIHLIILASLLFISCRKEKDIDTVGNVFLHSGENSDIIISTKNPVNNTSGGKITFIRNIVEILQHGVCWSTVENPTINDNYTSDGDGYGEFTSELNELMPLTTYYIRAYASTATSVFYGNEIKFTTLAFPVVTTNSISNFTPSSAISNGNINDAGYTIIERGVCWNTYETPKISNHYASSGSGGGDFTSNITGLIPATKYYIRAYAKDKNNVIYYGNSVFFTTSAQTQQGQICTWTSLQTFPCSTALIVIYIDDIDVGYLNSYYGSAPSCGASGTVTINAYAGVHKFYAKCSTGSTKWGPGYYSITAGTCFKWQLR